MMGLTPALAGQILVTAILTTVVAILLVAGVCAIYCQYQEQKERYERRMELRRRALRDDEDEIHEDFEHMRVVREHGAGTALEHRSIPYRRIAT